MKRRKEWVDELNIMLRLKKKAEIQARATTMTASASLTPSLPLIHSSCPLFPKSFCPDVAVQALSSFGFQYVPSPSCTLNRSRGTSAVVKDSQQFHLMLQVPFKRFLAPKAERSRLGLNISTCCCVCMTGVCATVNPEAKCNSCCV